MDPKLVNITDRNFIISFLQLMYPKIKGTLTLNKSVIKKIVRQELTKLFRTNKPAYDLCLCKSHGKNCLPENLWKHYRSRRIPE